MRTSNPCGVGVNKTLVLLTLHDMPTLHNKNDVGLLTPLRVAQPQDNYFGTCDLKIL